MTKYLLVVANSATSLLQYFEVLVRFWGSIDDSHLATSLYDRKGKRQPNTSSGTCNYDDVISETE
jgi:hypothetical protein